ncbi:ion transporter [Desulfogranum mediterraneum]|uniref:ion transporter n=1 Tax=Desulfogranum mediterraneum TaxID=160661 RepID=UPI000421F17C|nr:ion transporter [Desulfogranum mediterraneum]
MDKEIKPCTTCPWREQLYRIIFESDSGAAKLFDLLLIVAISASVGVVMLDSIRLVREEWLLQLNALEWLFTLIFTLEYLARLLAVDRPLQYARSFFGIIDLLAILPTYFTAFIPATAYMVVIRLLRILRIFRILKLGAYIGEADIIIRSLQASRKKIEVFLCAVLTLVVIFGSLMYVIEGEDHGFTSIPRSVYWAIVTLTTVGYGDISPQTGLGQMLASIIMVCGFGIIAVPTGIVSAEMVRTASREESFIICANCHDRFHAPHASYCKSCGHKLE